MFIRLICVLASATPVLLSPLSCAEVCKTLADGELNSSKCVCSLESSKKTQREKLDDSGIYFEPADIYTLHHLSFVQPPFIIINPGVNIKVERQPPKAILKRKSEKYSNNVSQRKATKHTLRNHDNKGDTLIVGTQPLYLDVDVRESGENSKERTSNVAETEKSRIGISEKDFKECVAIHLKNYDINNNSHSLIDNLMHNITTKCSQPTEVVKKSIEEIRGIWLRTADASLKSKSSETLAAEQSRGINLTDNLSTNNSHSFVRESQNTFTGNLLKTNDQYHKLENTTEDNLSQTQDSQTEVIFTTSPESTQQSVTSESHEDKKEYFGTTYLNTSPQNHQKEHQNEKISTVSLNSLELKSQENIRITENSNRDIIDIANTTSPLTSLDYEETPTTEYSFGQKNEYHYVGKSFNTNRAQEQTDGTKNNSGTLDTSEYERGITTVSSITNIEKELENGRRTLEYNYSTLEKQAITPENSFTISNYSQEGRPNDLDYRSHNIHSNITQEDVSFTDSLFQTIHDDLASITTDEVNDTNSNKSLLLLEMGMQISMKNNGTNKTKQDDNSTADILQIRAINRNNSNNYTTRESTTPNIYTEYYSVTNAIEQSTENNSDIYYISDKKNIKSNLDNVLANEFIKVTTDNNNRYFPSTLSQLTTNSQNETIKKIKRHGTVIGKNVSIPKVQTREFENDTVISEVNEDGETFIDDDFADDEMKSASTTLHSDGKTTALNKNTQYFTTSKSRNTDENRLSGNLYFLTGESYIPTRFVQNDKGELTIGMDLVTLCSKLNTHGKSRVQFIDMLCKILNYHNT